MFYPELPGPGTGTVSRLGTAGPGRAAVAYPNNAAGGGATVAVGRGPESTFRHSLKSSEPEKYHGQATPAGLDREGSSSDHDDAERSWQVGESDQRSVVASQDSAATVARLLDTEEPRQIWWRGQPGPRWH